MDLGKKEAYGVFLEFFNLFLTQPAPTWQRNVVSKSHTQMTLMWVRVANIHVHNHTRTSSLLRNGHFSYSKVGKEASWAAQGAESSDMPGESWDALVQSGDACPAGNPSCTYLLRRIRSFDMKRPMNLEDFPKIHSFKIYTHTCMYILHVQH